MAFGEYFRKRRELAGISLRKFCEQSGFDPGNISKLERGLLPAPQSEEKIKEYARALGLKQNSDEFKTFFDLALASSKQFQVRNITKADVLSKLPELFRYIDSKTMTAEKLESVIAFLSEMKSAHAR